MVSVKKCFFNKNKKEHSFNERRFFASKRILCFGLFILILFSVNFFNFSIVDAASTDVNLSVTLDSITCLSNNHVGNEWAFGFTANKTAVSSGSTIKLNAKSSDSIAISAKATEEDTYPDTNTKSLTIPVSKLKEGGNTYSLNVTVTENRGRYSGNTATWKFNFNIKKVTAVETQTISNAPDDKVRNGIDKYTWSNGTKYDGVWKNNKLNGKGTLTYANGDKYVGNFVNNKKSGSGTYTWKNGDIYTGNWSNDKMSGSGVYKFKNGDKYSGNWDAGFMNGKGTYTFRSGKTLTGVWVDNQYSSDD